MPNSLEQLDKFEPMSFPSTGTVVTDAEVVLDYSGNNEEPTQAPLMEPNPIIEAHVADIEESYLIPKKVIVRRYRLKK